MPSKGKIQKTQPSKGLKALASSREAVAKRVAERKAIEAEESTMATEPTNTTNLSERQARSSSPAAPIDFSAIRIKKKSGTSMADKKAAEAAAAAKKKREQKNKEEAEKRAIEKADAEERAAEAKRAATAARKKRAQEEKEEGEIYSDEDVEDDLVFNDLGNIDDASKTQITTGKPLATTPNLAHGNSKHSTTRSHIARPINKAKSEASKRRGGLESTRQHKGSEAKESTSKRKVLDTDEESSDGEAFPPIKKQKTTSRGMDFKNSPTKRKRVEEDEATGSVKRQKTSPPAKKADAGPAKRAPIIKETKLKQEPAQNFRNLLLPQYPPKKPTSKAAMAAPVKATPVGDKKAASRKIAADTKESNVAPQMKASSKKAPQPKAKVAHEMDASAPKKRPVTGKVDEGASKSVVAPKEKVAPKKSAKIEKTSTSSRALEPELPALTDAAAATRSVSKAPSMALQLNEGPVSEFTSVPDRIKSRRRGAGAASSVETAQPSSSMVSTPAETTMAEGSDGSKSLSATATKPARKRAAPKTKAVLEDGAEPEMEVAPKRKVAPRKAAIKKKVVLTDGAESEKEAAPKKKAAPKKVATKNTTSKQKKVGNPSTVSAGLSSTSKLEATEETYNANISEEDEMAREMEEELEKFREQESENFDPPVEATHSFAAEIDPEQDAILEADIADFITNNLEPEIADFVREQDQEFEYHFEEGEEKDVDSDIESVEDDDDDEPEPEACQVDFEADFEKAFESNEQTQPAPEENTAIQLPADISPTNNLQYMVDSEDMSETGNGSSQIGDVAPCQNRVRYPSPGFTYARDRGYESDMSEEDPDDDPVNPFQSGNFDGVEFDMDHLERHQSEEMEEPEIEQKKPQSSLVANPQSPSGHTVASIEDTLLDNSLDDGVEQSTGEISQQSGESDENALKMQFEHDPSANLQEVTPQTPTNTPATSLNNSGKATKQTSPDENEPQVSDSKSDDQVEPDVSQPEETKEQVPKFQGLPPLDDASELIEPRWPPVDSDSESESESELDENEEDDDPESGPDTDDDGDVQMLGSGPSEAIMVDSESEFEQEEGTYTYTVDDDVVEGIFQSLRAPDELSNKVAENNDDSKNLDLLIATKDDMFATMCWEREIKAEVSVSFNLDRAGLLRALNISDDRITAYMEVHKQYEDMAPPTFAFPPKDSGNEEMNAEVSTGESSGKDSPDNESSGDESSDDEELDSRPHARRSSTRRDPATAPTGYSSARFRWNHDDIVDNPNPWGPIT